MNVEEMRRVREESANVAYMIFNKHVKEGKFGLFCFFEGKDLQKAFHEAVTLFNAWYACLIHIRNTTNQQTEVSLGEDPIPKEFVTIALTGVSNNYDMDLLRLKYPDSLPIENQLIEDKILEFSIQNKGRIFRGKFEMGFMLRILTDLIQDSKTNKMFISKPVKYNIPNTQAISQFSQYAETPECLITYLQKVTR